MSDAEIIVLVLAIFYLSECALWVRPAAIVFLSLFGERCRALCSGAALRNDRGKLHFANPLPLGTAFVCAPWPLSLSPEAVFSYVAQALGADGRPIQVERYVPFEDIRAIEVADQQVLVNGVLLVDAGSSELARFLQGTLKKLAGLPRPERAAAIEATLVQIMDTEGIAKRLQEFRLQSQGVYLCCLVSFVYIFVFVPVLIWLFGISYYFFLALLGFIGLMVVTVIHYLPVHRSLYPGEKTERRKHATIMVLSPAASIRARDTLARDLLSCYHALAVAAVLCSRPTFLQLAQAFLLDMRFPMLPACPTDQPGPRATERWFRAQLGSALERLVRQSGADLEELLQPPMPESAECRSYCPRCHGQYTVAEGVCTGCGGQPLQPLVPSHND